MLLGLQGGKFARGAEARRTMSMVCFSCLVPGSQTVMRQSSPPAARYCPSGDQVTLLTQAASPLNSAVWVRRLIRSSLLLKLRSNARGPLPSRNLGVLPFVGRRYPSSLQNRRSLVPIVHLYYSIVCTITILPSQSSLAVKQASEQIVPQDSDWRPRERRPHLRDSSCLHALL